MTKIRQTVCLTLALSCIEFAYVNRIEASDSLHKNPKGFTKKGQKQNGVNILGRNSEPFAGYDERWIQSHLLLNNAPTIELQEADKLLLAGRFKEAELSYKQQLSSDTKGNSYVGAIYSILEQPGEGKLDEALIILREAKSKFADELSVRAATGYLAYLIAQRTKSLDLRKKYLDASQSQCLYSVYNRPNFVHPNLTYALTCASEEGPEAIKKSKQAYRGAFHVAFLVSREPFKTIAWDDNLWGISSKQKPEVYRLFKKRLLEVLEKGEKALERRDTQAAEKYYKEILEVLDCSRFYYPHLQYQEVENSKSKEH